MTLALPLRRYAPLWPYLYWSLTIVGAAYCALAIAGQVGIGECRGGLIPCDAAAYYYADGYEPVSITPQFGYSPTYLWAFEPFRWLPFEIFVGVWFGLHVAALLWLRAGWMLAIPGVNEDVIRGNVGVFIAMAVVVALTSRSAAGRTAWAFPLLTKVLPGVGLVWVVVRREWGDLAIALGATLAVVVVGTLIAPMLWVEWVELLAGRGTSVAGSIIPRLILAAGIVAYAAWTDRAWLIPIAIILGGRDISPPSLMKLAAIPRLIRADVQRG